MNKRSEAADTFWRSHLDLPLEEVCFCVFDTETTGFSPEVDRVVEAAGVHVSLKQGVLRHVSQLVNPQRPIPEDATATHGLRDEDVAQAGTLEAAMDLIRQRPFDAWVAHNAVFDFGFVSPGDTPVVGTLMLARRLWPELPEHKNQSLRAHWNLEVPEAEGLPAHRAEPDALVTSALLRLELKVLLERQPEIRTFRHFLDWLHTPQLLAVCPVGKRHRGKPWSEVPESYLTWMLENYESMDPDLDLTINHYLGR